jgi:hypothetical protein
MSSVNVSLLQIMSIKMLVYEKSNDSKWRIVFIIN